MIDKSIGTEYIFDESKYQKIIQGYQNIILVHSKEARMELVAQVSNDK